MVLKKNTTKYIVLDEFQRDFFFTLYSMAMDVIFGDFTLI